MMNVNQLFGKTGAQYTSYTATPSMLDIKTMTLIGASVLTVVAAMLYGLNAKTVTLDAANCDLTIRPKQSVTFFIDLTDKNPVSLEIKDRVITKIKRYRDSLKTGDRLSVFYLGSEKDLDPAVLRRTLSRCKPITVENTTSLAQGKKYIERQYDEQWVKPIDELIDGIKTLRPHEASSSPLMASIKHIATSPVAKAENKTLYVISDMRENSSKVTFYKSPLPTYAALQKQRLDLTDIENMLSETHVYFWQISKQHVPVKNISKNAYQRKLHEFWAAYMSDAGAQYKLSVF